MFSDVCIRYLFYTYSFFMCRISKVLSTCATHRATVEQLWSNCGATVEQLWSNCGATVESNHDYHTFWRSHTPMRSVNGNKM